MKVVHLCNVPLAPDHPDAARIQIHPGRWVLNLALAQKKYTAIDPLLVMQVPGSRRSHLTEVEGIPVHYLAAPDRFRSSTCFYFDVRRISHHVETWSPEVVHAHGTEDAYALAGLACHRPFVLTAQGCHFLINRELPPPPFCRERIIALTEHLALRRTRDVIAKSAYIAQALAQKFPHLRLHLIPNTLDPRLVNNLEGSPEKRPGSLAFVGTLAPRKGVDRLRRALEILRAEDSEEFQQIELHVFGNRSSEGVDFYEKAEIGFLKKLLGNRLHLYGIVPFGELVSRLSAIGVLVAPSVEEMFGNQVIEAMMLGTFPIVTAGTAMEENVRFFGFGSVVPQDSPSRLAEAIRERAFLAPQLDDVRATRAAILARMGPEEVARSHLRVYQDLCRGASVP